jgi:hypothetical protein
LHDLLADLVARYQGDDGGEVATYIPSSRRADAAWFGLSLVTMDGVAYEAGDSRQPFTIHPSPNLSPTRWRWQQRGPDDVEPARRRRAVRRSV